MKMNDVPGRRLAAGALAATFSLAMAAPAALSALPPAEENPYGVCSHLSRWGFDYRDESCRWISITGLRHVRCDFDWLPTQRERGAPYDWTKLDAVMESAERAGLQVLPILYGFPSWAMPEEEHLDEFAAWVEALVGRYRGRLPVVEIWNEENMPPKKYLAILAAAHDAAKRTDPGIRVWFGGTAGVPLEFIEGVYKLGGAGSFDAMNVHPYCPVPEGSIDVSLEKLRALMAQYGDGEKPIVVTESGWSTEELLADGNMLRAGLAVARPGKKTWNAVIAASDSGPDGKPPHAYAKAVERELPAGSTVEACFGARLRERLAAGDVDAVIYSRQEHFPVDTFEEVFDFVERGGVLVDFGGAPMWYCNRETAPGKFVREGQESERMRERLRIGMEAFWMDKDIPWECPMSPTEAAKAAGYVAPPGDERCNRYMTPKLLAPGDEWIPLLTGRNKSGREFTGACVIRRNGGTNGCVVLKGDRGAGPEWTTEEADQARYLVRSLAICMAEGVERFHWYEFRSTGEEPGYNQHHFGLVHSNFTPKPAWGAYRNFILARPAGSVQAPGPWHDEKREFYFPQWTRPDGTRAGVLWKTGPLERRELRFDSPDIRFRDYAGHVVHPVRIGDGRYIVALGEDPVFFEGGALPSWGAM